MRVWVCTGTISDAISPATIGDDSPLASRSEDHHLWEGAPLARLRPRAPSLRRRRDSCLADLLLQEGGSRPHTSARSWAPHSSPDAGGATTDGRVPVCTTLRFPAPLSRLNNRDLRRRRSRGSVGHSKCANAAHIACINATDCHREVAAVTRACSGWSPTPRRRGIRAGGREMLRRTSRSTSRVWA